MDPNETADYILDLIDAEKDAKTSTNPQEVDDLRTELTAAVWEIREWCRKGGFPPTPDRVALLESYGYALA